MSVDRQNAGNGHAGPRPKGARSEHLRKVAAYYDQTADLYLTALGTTCQAGLIPWFDDDPYRSTNLFITKRAEIKNGDRILDAGSGFCGPSIEICRRVSGAAVDSITISPSQARIARDLVKAAGLSGRVRIHVGDYHNLPMDDATFDLVMFIESSGHSRTIEKLYAEAYRVLRDGGRLYTKDLYRAKKNPTPAQRKQLKAFDALYVSSTVPVASHVKAMRQAGFREIEVATLSSLTTMDRINDAMWEDASKRRLSEFGRFHYRDFSDLPIVYSEIRALKAPPRRRKPAKPRSAKPKASRAKR